MKETINDAKKNIDQINQGSNNVEKKTEIKSDLYKNSSEKKLN